MAGTKNLGQVAGLFIGTNPPENTTLIWYDSTPSVECHKVYDISLQQWVVLDDSVIVAIEYATLKNQAQEPGLTIGQWFKITDKNNALALAITGTKVQYADSMGNILIDDLASTIQYHVTHQNILIDDVHGVFDEETKRLEFVFEETNNVSVLNDDYFLGERNTGSVWQLIKFRLSKLLSSEGGNSITWMNGFYLNFTAKFSSLLDVVGGAVSKQKFDTEMSNVRTGIQSISNNQQQIVEQTAELVAQGVSDENIYSKQIPAAPDASAAAAPIILGDTLYNIVSKCQRWFNRLKWATGIGISDDYAEATENFNVNNNDSVETAISKLAGHVRQIQTGINNGTDNVILAEDFEPQQAEITPGETTLTKVLENLTFVLKNNMQPILSIVAVYFNPTYENVTKYAGYGWIPCVSLKFANSSAAVEEYNKWQEAYPSLQLQIDGQGMSVGLFHFTQCVVMGENFSLPYFSDKFMRGVNSVSENVGTQSGANSHQITANELPQHTHPASCADNWHDHGIKTYATSLTGHNGTVRGKGMAEEGDAYATAYTESNRHNHTITVNENTTTHNYMDMKPLNIAVAYLIRVL